MNSIVIQTLDFLNRVQQLQWDGNISEYQQLCEQLMDSGCAHELVYTLAERNYLEHLVFVFHHAQKNPASPQAQVVAVAWGEHCTPSRIGDIVHTLNCYGQGKDCCDLIWAYLHVEKLSEHLLHAPLNLQRLLHTKSFDNTPNLLRMLYQAGVVTECNLTDFVSHALGTTEGSVALLHQTMDLFPMFFPQNTPAVVARLKHHTLVRCVVDVCGVDNTGAFDVLSAALKNCAYIDTDTLAHLVKHTQWNTHNFHSAMVETCSSTNPTLFNNLLDAFFIHAPEKVHVLAQPYMVHNCGRLSEPLKIALQKMVLHENLPTNCVGTTARKKM